MAEETGAERGEAIPWTIGTLVVTALIIYAAWNNARDNVRHAQETPWGEHAPARAPASH